MKPQSAITGTHRLTILRSLALVINLNEFGVLLSTDFFVNINWYPIVNRFNKINSRKKFRC